MGAELLWNIINSNCLIVIILKLRIIVILQNKFFMNIQSALTGI